MSHTEDARTSSLSAKSANASTATLNGQQSAPMSRKRPLPPSLINEEEPPPNKRIHTPTEEERESFLREKQNLYKRVLEEKNPMYMFPFLPLSTTGFSPVSPIYSFLQQQQANAMSSLGNSPLHVPSRDATLGLGNSASSAFSISGLPTPSGSSIGSTTPPRSTQMLTANLLKYPFSPPTPSSLSSLGLLSPWSQGAPDSNKPSVHGSPKPPESKSSPPKKSGSIPVPSASSILGALSSNQSCFLPGQPPLNYLQYPSPVSPMMYLNSPYMCSIPSVNSSIPSVSSSSGCSSSSDGAPGSVASVNNSYAPTEYHVGPRRPLIEKITEEIDNQIESPSNSGRNTPIDVGIEDNTVLSTFCPAAGKVDSVLLTQRLIADANTNNKRDGLPPMEAISRHHLTPDHQSYVNRLVDRPSSGISSMSSSVSSRDSTPEPGDIKHHALHNGGLGNELFCMVPGRLSLLSSTQKYPVGVDEVRRRLSHPECLNASVLGGILRRAKSKNGGHVLRQRLESIGVSLPPGRRKATDLSLFTSLVEGEAVHLAKDFHRLCDNYFPCDELAHMIASQHAGTPEAQHRISMVKATQLILNELQAMVNVASNTNPNDPTNPYPGLSNFGLITHNFGNPTINASLSTVQTYLKNLLAYYEGAKPVQPDPLCKYQLDNRLSSPGNLKPLSSSSITRTDCSRDDERNRSGLFVCLKQEPSE